MPTMMLPVTGPPHLLRGDLFAGVHEPASGRRSLRIDGGDVLLPDIIHGAVHRTEFFEVEQQLVCTENLNPDILVMKSAEDRA